MIPSRRHLSLPLAALVALLFTSQSAAESSLSGYYIYVQKTTSVTKMPVLSDVVATTKAVSIQKLDYEDGWLRGTGELCDVQIESNSRLVTTTLPPAFRRAIPAVTTNAKLTQQGGTLTFHQPQQTLVLGAELKEDEREPLPTSAQDARVRDQDLDGKPGVTVQISGIVSGEIYLVQRSTSSLRGHATEDGFHGNIHFTNDQSIIGATKKVLERNPGARPDPSRSEFLLRKIGSKISCAEAMRIARGW